MEYDKEYYWKNRAARALTAQKHTAEMEKKYKKEIKECAGATKIYRGDLHYRLDAVKGQKITLVNEDTVSAIFNHAEGRTAVLNFASYKHAGGMFLDGSRAQEECLCHESFLYNVLSRKEQFFNDNKKKLNKSLYTNAALYSPGVLFVRNDGNGEKTMKADVVSCAAPNWSAASRFGAITAEQNWRTLKQRIHFVRCVADQHDLPLDTIILGAFGCGVFGQNPSDVANMMIEEFSGSSIRNVVFAVPGNDKNYEAFKKAFEKKVI